MASDEEEEQEAEASEEQEFEDERAQGSKRSASSLPRRENSCKRWVMESDDDDDDEEEEEAEASEEQEFEDERAQGNKRSAASLDNEAEGSDRKRSFASPLTITSSDIAVDGTVKLITSRNEDEHTSSSDWIDKALASIRVADLHILNRSELLALPFPMHYLPRLQNVRSAASTLLNHADDAISNTQKRQYFLEKKASEELFSATLRELKQSQSQYTVQVGLLQQARAEAEKQKDLFQKEKEALTSSYKSDREAIETHHRHEQRMLQRQLDEEKDKSICCVCHDKPRDTIILPCLHFQYCFSCLLRHRDVNSNTCPTCRGPIQGLSMSSYLASQ